ncbi:hypothetical protein FACS1894187_07160 [Synergistales bacterium]|nr:hypothetical protein FACS1894187_07160 [Synergistales bacterium]
MPNDKVMEFEIEYDDGTVKYRAGILDAFSQLYVTKRLVPILKGFTEIAASETGDMNLSSLDKFLDAVSGLKDEDLKYIISTCLSVVSKQSGKAWVKLTAVNGALMFEDMGVVEMLTLCWYVIKANLSGFTRGLPSGLRTKLSEWAAQFSRNSLTTKESSGVQSSPVSPSSATPRTVHMT